jgi:hypothetical protein
VPTKIADGVSTIKTSGGNFMYTTGVGYLYAWGGNYGGMLGDGTDLSINTPKKISISTKRVDRVSIGSAHTLVLTVVENAFKHGVSPNNRSFINIDIHMTDNKRLICTIKNSYFPKTETDRSGSGIGLENLRRRLGLLYPERYTFTNTIENDVYTSELTILL